MPASQPVRCRCDAAWPHPCPACRHREAEKSVECPRCRKMVDGVHTCSPQFKKSPESLITPDAIKDPIHPNTHSPDAGTKLDYIAWLQELDVVSTAHRLIGDAAMSRSLADHLTALREAMRGCGRIDIYRSIGCEEPYLCGFCAVKRDQVITALTHTDQGGEI